MNSSIGGAAPETASAGETEAYVKDQMHDLTRGLRDKLRRRLHAISDRLEEMKERQDNVVQSRSERFRSHFDIVGSLPLEIVLQIVTCLDPEDIARSRRVSQQWLYMFSCDTITKFHLRQTLTFLNIDGVDEATADATTYFRWRYGLQSGRPVKKIFLPFQDDEKGPASVWYHSRRLFYCTNPWYGIQMLDLETGEKLAWFREEDMDFVGEGHVLVSDRCIVLHDFSLLVARNIHTKRRCARGDLPCYPRHIDLEKDILVLVELLEQKQSLWFVYIWDLNSNRIRRIGKFTNLWLWHVDADENLLVVFEINWDTHPPQVQQTKWTLKGERMLDRKHFHLSLSGHPVVKNRLKPLDSFSNRTYGRKKIRRLLTGTGIHDAIDLIYDHAIDKLRVRWTSLQPQIYDLGLPLCALLTPNLVYHWNPRFLWLEICDADNQTRIQHPCPLDIREVETCKGLRNWPVREDESPLFSSRPYLNPLGDREVVGLASEDGIQMWFFNPHFVPNVPYAKPFDPMWR